MSSTPKAFWLTPELHRYLVNHGTPPDKIQQELIAETHRLGGIAEMQIAPEQGSFLTILVKLIGVHKAIEIGTFTGYSALCIARGLNEDDSLLCCDVNEEWTTIAKRYWKKAGVSDRIKLVLAPALDTLRALSDESVYDFAFIDADKSSYVDYYEEVLKRIRPGGVILVDNVLWNGKVVDVETDETTKVIQKFNDHVAADDRVDCVMLSISDGLTLLRKH